MVQEKLLPGVFFVTFPFENIIKKSFFDFYPHTLTIFAESPVFMRLSHGEGKGEGCEGKPSQIYFIASVSIFSMLPVMGLSTMLVVYFRLNISPLMDSTLPNCAA